MRTVLLFLGNIACSLLVEAQNFQNVTSMQNIDVFIDDSLFGNGVSFADFNNDGWDDLTFATNIIDPVFYSNLEGTYSLIDLGIVNEGQGDVKAILWVDYDNDGDQDLFISTSFHPVKLYNNDGLMNLTDVTADAGILSENTRNYGASWGDYNNDGWLDLYMCKYHNPDINVGYAYENHLYKSNQDGTFTELANFAGVGNGVSATFQSVFFDFDKDGFEDIYVINDRYAYSNALYHNNGDGTFENVSISSGTNINIDAMCINVGDYDNDQDLDIYVSNTELGNVLFNNQGDGTFEDIAVQAGVPIYEICWGSLWIDFDNNMLQDLYVATIDNIGTIELQNQFFINTGDGFEESSILNDVFGTHSLSMGDYNNDGFPDFVQGNCAPSHCQLYRNGGSSNNWLKVSVEGVVSNRDGIGCWIQVYAGDVVQTRTVNCGEQYLGQDSPREMFGLAGFETIDSLTVKWPSGIIDKFYGTPSNQTMHIIEGSSSIFPLQFDDDLTLCGQDSILLTAEENAVAYNWSTGDSTQSIFATTSGEYYCDITSEFGLVFPSDTITIVAAPELELDNFAQHISCHGGQDGIALVSAAGEGQLNSIDWIDGFSGYVLNNLFAGTYWFTAGDVNNCFVTDFITINEPDSLIITATTIDVPCYGETNGEVDISWIGGTGNLYCFTEDQNEEALPAGLYTWECSDQNNCISQVSFEIEQPDELVVELSWIDISGGISGGAQVDISGGTPDYIIEWSSGEDDSQIEILDPGNFWVSVQDQNGCDTTITFLITGMQEWIGTDFSVFPNPFENQITLINESSETYSIELFSPLGELVMEEDIAPGSRSIELATTWAGMWIMRIRGNNKSAVIRLTRQ
jgi:hypothetical protein